MFCFSKILDNPPKFLVLLNVFLHYFSSSDELESVLKETAYAQGY